MDLCPLFGDNEIERITINRLNVLMLFHGFCLRNTSEYCLRRDPYQSSQCAKSIGQAIIYLVDIEASE